MKKEDLQLIPKCPGIYKITNTINNKSYIGQSINLKRRLNQHLTLWNNPRVKKYLYSAIAKYGIENFKIEILEILEMEITDELKTLLDKYEVYYISKFKTFGEGYNETKGGENILGVFHTKSVRLRISQSLKNYYNSPEGQLFLSRFKKQSFGFNYKENYFIEASSRVKLSDVLRNRGYNISPTLISHCIVGINNYVFDFVFGNTKEECLEKLKFFQTENAKHSSAFAPNYNKYFEYLKEIVDKNGYLPKIEDIAKHYGRANTTIIGWNKHIPNIKLDKHHNRLMLEGYSNSNIEYDLTINKKINKYSIFIISENKTLIVTSKEGGEYFNIKPNSFIKLTKNKSPYKNNYIISKYS